MNPNRQRYTTHSEEETEIIAAGVAPRLRPGDIITLDGDLGAGKSVFARGIARQLGINERMPSPTFALVLEYPGEVLLNHVDLYRISSAEEFELLDISWRGSISLVEWAERAPDLYQSARVQVHIERIDEHARNITIEWSDAIPGN